MIGLTVVIERTRPTGNVPMRIYVNEGLVGILKFRRSEVVPFIIRINPDRVHINREEVDSDIVDKLKGSEKTLLI